MRGGAEVVSAIIEGDVISVVNEAAFARFNNLPVHRDDFIFAAFEIKKSDGVNAVTVSARRPVELVQPIIISGVNEGEEVLAEWNFSKGVVVTQAAIKQNGPGEDKIEPDGNIDLQVSKHKNLPSQRNPKL